MSGHCLGLFRFSLCETNAARGEPVSGELPERESIFRLENTNSAKWATGLYVALRNDEERGANPLGPEGAVQPAPTHGAGHHDRPSFWRSGGPSASGFLSPALQLQGGMLPPVYWRGAVRGCLRHRKHFPSARRCRDLCPNTTGCDRKVWGSKSFVRWDHF